MEDKIKREIERKALNTLLEKGIYFEIPGRLFFRRKKWRFTIRQLFLGTIDHLSDLYLQIDIDEEKIKEDPQKEARRLAGKHAKLMARVVAIALLNSYFGIKFFSGILSYYLLWKINPQRLFELTIAVKTLSNTGDFIASIRSLSLVRTTTPREEPETDRIENTR